MSKASLAWNNNNGQQEIMRVPWQGEMDDPEHPDTSRFQGSPFSFVSSAALTAARDEQGSQLSVGRQSLSNDNTFPIKTLLLWAAGIRRWHSLNKAPCGSETITAVSAGEINVDMVEQVFAQHLRLVYNMALTKAVNLGLTIVHVCITHPNFLCEDEEADDFRRWAVLCRRVVFMVCGEDKSISTISEGQSLAGVCPFFPPTAAMMATNQPRRSSVHHSDISGRTILGQAATLEQVKRAPTPGPRLRWQHHCMYPLPEVHKSFCTPFNIASQLKTIRICRCR